MRMAKIYITALATYYFRKEKTIWAKGMKTLCRRDCDFPAWIVVLQTVERNEDLM